MGLLQNHVHAAAACALTGGEQCLQTHTAGGHWPEGGLEGATGQMQHGSQVAGLQVCKFREKQGGSAEQTGGGEVGVLQAPENNQPSWGRRGQCMSSTCRIDTCQRCDHAGVFSGRLSVDSGGTSWQWGVGMRWFISCVSWVDHSAQVVVKISWMFL